jgi:hypothetical protein
MSGVVEIPRGDCVKSYSSCVSGRDSVEIRTLATPPSAVLSAGMPAATSNSIRDSKDP